MRIVIAALVAVFSCLNTAYAETYARAMAGTKFDFDFKDDAIRYGDEKGYAIAGAVGTEIAEYKDFSFAVEGELTWLRTAFETRKGYAPATNLALMANGIVRLDPGGVVRPYAGGGIGLSANTFDEERYYPGMNWQAIGGLNFKLNRRFGLDVQYRYMGQDYLPLADSTQRQHVVMAGVVTCLGDGCWPFW